MPRGFMRRQKPAWQQKQRPAVPFRPPGGGLGKLGARGAGKYRIPPGEVKHSRPKEIIKTDLEQEFESAAAEAKKLKNRPSDSDLLRLYALFKQATAGDISGPESGFGDFIGEAKHEAWAKLRGTSRESAMGDYVNLVKNLKK